MTEPRSLNFDSIPEVHLPRSPLARVFAQVRFSMLLAIRDQDRVVNFQDALRDAYPEINQDQIHTFRLSAGEESGIQPDFIWRLTDRPTRPTWRVSLGVNFVTLETSSYTSRGDFLERLYAILLAVEESFGPASAHRIGLRYIDRLTGEAVDRITELVHAEILGIMQKSDTLNPVLRNSIIQQLTEVQFLAPANARVQGRWGKLPANITYDADALEPVEYPSWILDLDMFTIESQPFVSEELRKIVAKFAEYLYSVFRNMVTPEFLKFYGA